MPRFYANLIETQMVAVKNLTLVAPQFSNPRSCIAYSEQITPRDLQLFQHFLQSAPKSTPTSCVTLSHLQSWTRNLRCQYAFLLPTRNSSRDLSLCLYPSWMVPRNHQSGGDGRITRSRHRTQLMRRCWRAIFNMPKLVRLEFWIMPSQGRISANELQHGEVRDIIPTHFRLSLNGVNTLIYLRTWQVDNNDLDSTLVEKSDYDFDDDGFYESLFNLGFCIPYKWRKPPNHEAVIAGTTSADQDSLPRIGSYGYFQYQP